MGPQPTGGFDRSKNPRLSKRPLFAFLSYIYRKKSAANYMFVALFSSRTGAFRGFLFLFLSCLVVSILLTLCLIYVIKNRVFVIFFVVSLTTYKYSRGIKSILMNGCKSRRKEVMNPNKRLETGKRALFFESAVKRRKGFPSFK